MRRVVLLMVLSIFGAHAFTELPVTGRGGLPRRPAFGIRSTIPNGLFTSFSRRQRSALHASSSNSPKDGGKDDEQKLRWLMLPVWLSVFVHMLGVGVTISQLPLYITDLGASPMHLGLAISGFSVAQMVCCPPLVSLSNRLGRLPVMRMCLAGNAAASLLTAASSSWHQIAIARMVGGVFAASVPVSQAAVAEIARPGPDTSRALSQVSAATSLGLVAGPAFAGAVSEVASRFFGAPAHLLPKIVFAVSGVAAASVSIFLELSASKAALASPPASTAARSKEDASSSAHASDGSTAPAGALAQPLVRWIALMTSWGITLTVSTYSLFAARFMSYTQRHLNANSSAAAAVAVCMQLGVIPFLCRKFGDERACAGGLATMGAALSLSALLLSPRSLHVSLFLLFRAGTSIAEVANVALAAKNSAPARRARNLALLQSTQAAGRIVSPLLAGWMYERSLVPGAAAGGAALGLPAGALPFVVVGGLAALTAPLPLLLSGSGDSKIP